MVRTLINELQKDLQTSDVSILSDNVEYPINFLTFFILGNFLSVQSLLF